jgi:hypothetical protein
MLEHSWPPCFNGERSNHDARTPSDAVLTTTPRRAQSSGAGFVRRTRSLHSQGTLERPGRRRRAGASVVPDLVEDCEAAEARLRRFQCGFVVALQTRRSLQCEHPLAIARFLCRDTIVRGRA